MASNDDDDSYVTIGTPFDIPEDNEPLAKPSKVEDQIATDEKGRRRFHGAFTGGFSAGYFNTVGSKEGWAPASFKSSRSKKNDDEQDTKLVSKPEDFMDEEDFAEHGIAPKKLKTAFSHSSTESNLESQKKSFLRAIGEGEVHSAIPGGGDPLVDLLSPPKHSVGIQLLKKMGWKPGQGIGEKIELSPEKEAPTVTKKVYGCALPPKSRVESFNVNTFKMMLAPKDIQPVTFNKKDNFHGIGYSGIITVETKLRSTAGNCDQSFRPTGKEKKGIRGQAFGIGVFEEEDDDIYGENSLSNYDMTMVDDNDDKHGWTGSMLKPKTYKDCLPGFIKSLKKLSILVPPVTIQAPHNIPRHIFPDEQQNKNPPPKDKTNNNDSLKRTKLTSEERSNLLGEATKSMDDIKHWTLKWDKGVESKTTSESASGNVSQDINPVVKEIPVDVTKSKPTRWDKDIGLIKPKQNNQANDASKSKLHTPSNKNEVFQPFSRYPEKQARYEVYLESVKKGHKPDFKYDTLMTEWEKEQEIAEFTRAATMYKPLVSTMASRFVRANFVGSEDTAKDKEKPDDKKAAEMGMFGKLTRTILDWHPDPVLCKRMNIPNPYPNSKIKGVPSRNKKHSSFFSDINDNKSITLPDENKSDDVEEEDEFFSRIQKNKQKLLKSKTGPLSHLNIKLDCHKTNSNEISNLNNTNNNTNSELTTDVEKEVIVKPSIDIFKAIFENSDSENSEDNDDNEKEKPEDKSMSTNTESRVSSVPSSELNSECKAKVPLNNEKTSNDNSQNVNVQNKTKGSTEKNNKFLPLSFLNPDQQSKIITPSRTEPNFEKEKLSHGKINEVSLKNRSGETNSALQKNSSLEKDSANTEDKVLDTSINKHDRSKHKKRKKEKKSKKHKKKNYSPENSDNESDNKHKEKKKNHSDDSQSDSEKYYKKKKKKKYRSDDSDDDTTNKTSKKKKSKRHRSSSSSSDGSVVPNAVLLEKLKNFAQSSRRPTAADFM